MPCLWMCWCGPTLHSTGRTRTAASGQQQWRCCWNASQRAAASQAPPPARSPTPRTDNAAAGADGGIAPEQSQQKLRCSPSMQLVVFGRGLMPESPRATGPGSTAGATSPSTIIQTLKQDSLSAWHRVSPERQAAHRDAARDTEAQAGEQLRRRPCGAGGRAQQQPD